MQKNELNLTKDQILKKKEHTANWAAGACITGIALIIVSPSIPITAIVTLAAATAGMTGLKKIKKYKAMEEKLDSGK